MDICIIPPQHLPTPEPPAALATGIQHPDTPDTPSCVQPKVLMPSKASSRSKRGQRSQQQLGRKETANMRAAEQDRSAKAASKQAETPKSKSKNGIPSSSIIEHNRKTELCRNYENGSCTFGGRCAFAHGLDDMKHKTLRDLEKEGRIADASKYQACLCQTWVATGTCLYGRRCIFIHDDRVKGTVGLSPRASTLAKSAASRISSSTGSSGGGSGLGSSPLCPAGEDNDNGSLLFFPDRSRDPKL